MKQPLPSNPHGSRLAEIFSYGWQWIESPFENNTTNTDWKTNTKYPLKPRVLWSRWQDAATLIGVRFGSSTCYAMLDIDKDSVYIDAIGTIKGALETIGIVRTVTIRSSWSGGLHIYIPLPQAYPTFSVACALKQCLEAQGLNLAPGQLEVFPNEKPFAKAWLGEFSEYNGHRLPLQPGSGSCLLDGDLQPVPGGYDLSRFLALWDNAVVLNDHAEISEALGIARANRRRRRRKGSPGQDWKEDLERIIAEGWTGPGQTNQLLKEIACYGRVFERLAGSALAEYVLKTVLSSPGYERWCQHQPEILSRVNAWCRAAEKFYWPFGTEPMRQTRTLMSICEERALDAQGRIKEAVRELQFESGTGIKVMARAICELARCSAATLYKYKDLWHPAERVTEPVTPPETGDTDDPAVILRLIREGIGTIGNGGVTGSGGDNEALTLISPPLKKFTSGSGGKEKGGRGEEKGVSTAGRSEGWLPAMNWKPGGVADVG